jgi:hypothetical protein
MFTYQVRTVTHRFNLVGYQTVVTNETAEQIGTRILAMGYKAVDVAPGHPVNGYPEGSCQYRANDTWSNRTYS